MLKLLGRRAAQEPPLETTRAEIRAAITGVFDQAFYLSTYPDVAKAACDPLDHYIKYGAREGRDPSATFCTTYYLSQNPDVRESGMNPLHHFVLHGEAEGRKSRDNSAPEVSLDAWVEDLDETCALIADQIDPVFYLQRNSDLEPAEIDPARHYLTKGAAEGRDPAPWFSTRYYLDRHEDVRKAGINPLVHYVQSGEAEGRLTQPPGGFRAEALRKLDPLNEQVARWRTDRTPTQPLTAEALARAIWREGDLAPWMVLSISHDDYATNTGGIQLAVQSEAAAFAQERIDYINIHPAQPLPVLAPEDGWDGLKLTLRRNGHVIGTASAGNLALVLDRLAAKGLRFDLVVHALQGHAPEAIARIAEAARARNNFFWLHDSFTICPSFTLMRNGIRYCGAPAADSTACGVCVFGEERLDHAPRLRQLFENVSFTAVAPSSTTAKRWQAQTTLPVKRLVVHSHCTLATQVDPGSCPIAEDAPLRLAFIGFPSLYKGWPAFEGMIRKFGDDPRYRFHYFGTAEMTDPRIVQTRISVTRDDREAMQHAVHEAEIDIAVLWSLCPETFSFAAHEALGAGALILTHKDSGNIAAMVRDQDAGWVLDDEASAISLLEGSAWRDRVAKRRAEAGPVRAVAYSDLTADLLLRGDSA